MFDICYDEFEELKRNIKNDTFIGVQYLDTWDYEDEYSHNHIDANRDKFIELANDFFKEEKLPYTMREVNENAMVCDLEGNILKKG